MFGYQRPSMERKMMTSLVFSTTNDPVRKSPPAGVVLFPEESK
jgi:hypothetical protein